MKSTSLLLAIVSCLTIALTNCSQQPKDANALLKAHFSAIGVDKAIAKVSYTLEGKMKMMNLDIPFKLSFKRPSKMRMDMNLMGNSTTAVLNGDSAFVLMKTPTGADTTQDIPTNDLKEKNQYNNTLNDMLYTAQQQKATFKLLGKDTANKIDVYKIQVADITGDTDYAYIDTKTNYLNRYVLNRVKDGIKVTVTINYTNFKNTEGIVIPYSYNINVATEANGAAKDQQLNSMTMDFDKVTFADLDDQLFKKPNM